MKVKKLICILLVLLLLFSLSSCKKTTKDYSATELCNMISRDLFKDQKVTVINEEQLLTYFSFSKAILNDWRVAISDNDDKVFVAAVFEPNNKFSEKIVVNALNAFVSQTAARLKNLNDNEYTKISSRLVYKHGNNIILVVTDDYPTAEKYLKDLGAKEYK